MLSARFSAAEETLLGKREGNRRNHWTGLGLEPEPGMPATRALLIMMVGFTARKRIDSPCENRDGTWGPPCVVGKQVGALWTRLGAGRAPPTSQAVFFRGPRLQPSGLVGAEAWVHHQTLGGPLGCPPPPEEKSRPPWLGAPASELGVWPQGRLIPEHKWAGPSPSRPVVGGETPPLDLPDWHHC